MSRKTKKTSQLAFSKKSNSSGFSHILIFALIFGIIGSIFMFRIFAAPAPTERSGDDFGSVKATLSTADGRNIGTVGFKTEAGHTQVQVRLAGTPGVDAFHGFHIHANDVAANGVGCIADPAAAPTTWFVSADGHFNPTALTHSHHIGDMPVVYVNADGSVVTRFQIDKINPADLIGKAVILHAGADNFANIPVGTALNQYTANSADATTATAKTGNAGNRIACGVISATAR